MMISHGLYHSLTSGTLASSASLFSKLSMSPTVCKQLLISLILLFMSNEDSVYHLLDTNSLIIPAIQTVLFVAMISTNVLMWIQFTKALKHYDNSLQVIVVNTSTNFFVTAFYGKVLFNESLSTIWWIGSTLILIGLLIMKTSNSNHKTKNE